MTTDPAIHRRSVSIDAELRRQLSEASSDRDALRQTLIGEGDLAASQNERALKRGAVWWMNAFTEVSRHRKELLTRNAQLERWLKESGAEATALQRIVAARDREIGELARALELARSGERCSCCTSREVD